MEHKKNNHLLELFFLIISISLLIYVFLLFSSTNNKNGNDITDNKQIIENNEVSNEKLNLLANEQDFNILLPILEEKYENEPNKIENVLNYANVLANIWSLKRSEKDYWNFAIKFANYALNLDPNNSEAYRIIWYANEIMENYDDAFTAYDKSIKLDENNALAYWNRWHAYGLVWKTEEAEKDFLISYKLDSSNSHVLMNLARGYLSKWEDKEALKYFKEVVKKSTNIRFKSEALFSIWNLQINDKNYKDAEETFINSIDIDPNFELGYIWLAKTQFLLFLKQVKKNKETADNSLVDSAIENYNKSIEINPNKTLAYYQLALLYMDVWHYEETEKNFIKALEVIPNDITLSKPEKEAMLILVNNHYTLWN